MKHVLSSGVFLLVMAFILTPAFADTYKVCSGSGCDFSTIQAALNSGDVGDGDIVLVSPGTYCESIDWPDKDGITLQCDDSDHGCIIDAGCKKGSGGMRPIYIEGLCKDGDRSEAVDITTKTVIKGFSIINGNPCGDGGGIRINRASPTIEDNKIMYNDAGGSCRDDDYDGGGIYIYFGAPVIKGNRIEENDAGFLGGGIYCYGGYEGDKDDPDFPVITGNVIVNNKADFGGGILSEYSAPLIGGDTQEEGNEIEMNTAWNAGGGIFVYKSSNMGYGGNAEFPIIKNNEIIDNEVTGGDLRRETEIYTYYYYGGGIAITESAPVITENFIAGNSVEYVFADRVDADDEDDDVEHHFYFYGGGIAQVWGFYDDCEDREECCDCAMIPTTITDNIILGNSTRSEYDRDDDDDEYYYSSFGGGIFLNFSNANVTGNIIADNWSEDGYGGGIFWSLCLDCDIMCLGDKESYAYNYESDRVPQPVDPPQISFNLLASNEAAVGGGIGVYSCSCCHVGSPQIINNTFFMNSAYATYLSLPTRAVELPISKEGEDRIYGGGIAVFEGPGCDDDDDARLLDDDDCDDICERPGPTDIRNNIISGSYGGGLYVFPYWEFFKVASADDDDDVVTPTVAYNDFWENYAGDTLHHANIDIDFGDDRGDEGNNISEDPLFIGGEFIRDADLARDDDDDIDWFNLSWQSPCVDTGDPDTEDRDPDLDIGPDTGEHANMGAYRVCDNTPIAPSGLNTTLVNYNNVNLSWTNNDGSEDVDGIKIYRRTEGGIWTEIDDIGDTQTTYSDTGLTTGFYYYKVCPYNDCGESCSLTVGQRTISAPPGAGGPTIIPPGAGQTTPENFIPNAAAGEDQQGSTGESSTLDGSSSWDFTNDPLSYEWTIVSAPAGSTAALSSPNTAVTAFTPDVCGTYVFKLEVNDGKDSDFDEVTLTVPCEGAEESSPVTEEERKSSSGGCFIATAAWGSEEAPVVQRYIYFRDHHLLNSALGKTFVSLYYKLSPGVAGVIAQYDVLKAVVRVMLTPMSYLFVVLTLAGGLVLRRSRG